MTNPSSRITSAANRHTFGFSVVLAVTALFLTACAGSETGTAEGAAAVTGNQADPDREAAPKEAPASAPRLIFTHGEGIAVLDAKTLKPAGEAGLEGFTRLDPAGDGRHVLVSTGDSFRIFDAGAWTEKHGDHGHSYVGTPQLTDRAFSADRQVRTCGQSCRQDSPLP